MLINFDYLSGKIYTENHLILKLDEKNTNFNVIILYLFNDFHLLCEFLLFDLSIIRIMASSIFFPV